MACHPTPPLPDHVVAWLDERNRQIAREEIAADRGAFLAGAAIIAELAEHSKATRRIKATRDAVHRTAREGGNRFSLAQATVEDAA